MGLNLLAVNTRNHTGPTPRTTHTWLHWLCKCCFFSLQSAKKGAFYLINENGQPLRGLKWTTLKRLERFQTGLWTRDNSKCWTGSVKLMKKKGSYY